MSYIYCLKSRFFARRRKTKFPSICLTIFSPNEKKIEYSYPLIDCLQFFVTKLQPSHTVLHVTLTYSSL